MTYATEFPHMGDDTACAAMAARAEAWGAHLDPLVAEFAAWTASQGIDSDEGDALELLMVDRTPEQRAWLNDFIARWDVAQAATDAQEVA